VVDLDARLSWAYVMNKMRAGLTGDTRSAGLATALYAACEHAGFGTALTLSGIKEQSGNVPFLKRHPQGRAAINICGNN